MGQAHQLVFIGSLLLLAGILAGTLSSRIGAPLLLAFLGLGMVAGPDGLGLQIPDKSAAYLIGSTALTLILFDGGLHTRRRVFRLAFGPSLSLATLGVALTAVITALPAHFLLGLGWIQAGLIGAIVSSTDAAAVFLLLHQRGRDISHRVAATLETEAGFNDPVAVFLTITLVQMLSDHGAQSMAETGLFLLRQAVIGTGLGLAGGWTLVALVNRLPVTAGLYPIMVMAGTLCLFSGTQIAGGSGFLAVYLAGIICGISRLRASQIITRFHEGMAWLAQLILFIMLGLMVVPHQLLPQVPATLGIVLVLVFVARPLAVWLCLIPFRFTVQERLFIAWVGLRGAVPIFLAMIPSLEGLPHAEIFSHAAFIVVLASLVLQGWTIAPAARWLRLELPAEPTPGQHLDLGLAADDSREISAWRVAAESPASERAFESLPLPGAIRLVSVLREGMVMELTKLDRLHPGDMVLAVVPPEMQTAMDRLFAARPKQGAASATLGDFVLDPAVKMAAVVDLYGLPGTLSDREKPAGAFLRQRLGREPVVGDRVHLGLADLIVRRMNGDRIAEIGVALEPERDPLDGLSIRRQMRNLGLRLRGPFRRRPRAGLKPRPTAFPIEPRFDRPEKPPDRP
ncbi:MAG: potassium/hydrogen antiporter [Aliidongia sp.]|nr:potassium/hydrogen antiporter [Aliidongia sp.]